MKTLPAGTLKYLLVDDVRVIANASRGKVGEPVVVVIEEVSEDGRPRAYIEHRAHRVLVEGPVILAYDQHRPAIAMHRRTTRAAYATAGVVVLSETADETLMLPAKPPADPPAKPKKAPSKK